MKSCKRTVTPAFIAASALFAAIPAQAANTGLAVAAQLVSSSCSAASTTMEIDVAATATAGAPLTLFVSTGGDYAAAGQMSWTSHGRTKAAEETVQVTIAPGVHSVGICVAQPGSDANPARSACASVAAPPPCDQGSGSDWT